MQFTDREIQILADCAEVTYRAFPRAFPEAGRMDRQPLGKLRRRLLREAEAQTARARKADAAKRSRVAKPER